MGSVPARVLAAASAAFLFLAAFASSAGLRATALVFCAGALCTRPGESLRILRDGVPRDVAIAGLAWVAICVASLAWSVDPAYTLGELKPELVYGVLAFVVFFVAAARDPSLWPAWWTALMAGAAVGFAAQALQDVVPVSVSRHAVDGGPGPFSTHLVLLLPLLFALDWPPPWGRDHRPRVLVLGLCVFLAAAWYTGNRIVWLAFATQLAVGIATWRKLPEDAAQRAVTLRRLGALAIVAIAVAFAASVAERNQRNLLHDTGVPPGLSHDLRPRIWRAAWGEFVQAPWLGHGFGREVLAPVFIPLTPKEANHPQLLHGHNTFVDMALEVGVVGLAAFVVLLAALARRYRAMLADPLLAPLGMIGLALLAGFIVKNFTDDFLHRHNALVFWSLNAMLLGLARSTALRAAAQPP
jgi:O-antigen ligase